MNKYMQTNMAQSKIKIIGLTEEAGFAEVHVHALQTAIAVPRSHPLTAVTGDHHIEQVTVASNEHVHLRAGRIIYPTRKVLLSLYFEFSCYTQGTLVF